MDVVCRLGKRSPSASLNSLMGEPGYRMYLQLIQAIPDELRTPVLHKICMLRMLAPAWAWCTYISVAGLG